MPDPFIMILMLSLIFLFMLGVSFIINAIYVLKGKPDKNSNSDKNQKPKKPPEQKTENPPDENTECGKIYYIEKYKQNPVKRKKRKPDIALKGTVISPEEFKKFSDNN